MPLVINEIGSFEKFDQFKTLYLGKKILLVTGKTSYSQSGAKAILNHVLKDEMTVRFHDFEVNPKIDDAIRGVSFARENNIDLIIAVGGGSAIDMAKLIKAFYASPNDCYELSQGKLAVSDPGIPLIAVPTTAGSGSEATHFAVVNIGYDKYSLASQLLLPDIAVLDGNLIDTCSPYQKACNGLDALAQSIESAWAAGSTEQSRGYAFEAVELCVKNLKSVVGGDTNPLTLQGMSNAAYRAGNAINISKTTAAHAWSYGITNHHGIPHGHAVWLTLPKVFKMHATADTEQVSDARGLKHLQEIMHKLMKSLNIEVAEQADTILENFMMSLGVPHNFKMIGAERAEQRAFLAKQANMERMSNNPVSFTDRDISEIFSLD